MKLSLGICNQENKEKFWYAPADLHGGINISPHIAVVKQKANIVIRIVKLLVVQTSLFVVPYT